MENIIKAKVIIELLDELKYPVLSSFSSQELGKLNAVDLEALNAVSATDISSIIDGFLANVEDRKKTRVDTEASAPNVETPIVKTEPPKIEEKPNEPAKDLTAAEKIQLQPPQLIACILDRVTDDQRKDILSKLPEDKKQLVEAIEVEKTPISEQVIQVIMNELELSPQ